MRILGLTVPLVFLFVFVFLASPGHAVDLKKIDRNLKVQPTYKTRFQKYCLLVFGKNAEKRIWLVRDGNDLHVDKNGNQILGEPGERFTSHSPTSTTDRVFHIPGISQTSSRTPVSQDLKVEFESSSQASMILSGPVEQRTGLSRRHALYFKSTIGQAPIVHFNGPLTLARYTDSVPLPENVETAFDRHTWLRMVVGSKGWGGGTFVAWNCKCRKGEPDLEATFVFPSGAPNVKLLVQDVVLDAYSSGYCLFGGPIQIPKAASSGTGEVTVAFPKSPEIQPGTMTFPVKSK